MSIVVDLFGGMGNQLFQYFFGYSLGRESGIPVTYTAKNLKIGNIGLPLTLAYGYDSFYKYKEPTFHFHPVKARPNTVYTGYWQSEKYFAKYADEIRGKSSVPASNPGVSLHVRRGDYLRLPNYHPVQPIDYYVNAAKMFPDKQVKVFSDDLPWCKQNLPKEWEYSANTTAEADFAEMSSYQNHVISNSTFSWWAAWISNGNVIAPKKWLGPAFRGTSTKDIIPERWTIL